jgi:hypothetical protein
VSRFFEVIEPTPSGGTSLKQLPATLVWQPKSLIWWMNKMSDYYKRLGKKDPFVLKDSYTGELHPVSKKVFVKALRIASKKA